MNTDAAQAARRSPELTGQTNPTAPMESDKTLQQISINKSLSPDLYLEENAREEKTNEEKFLEAKGGKAKTLPMEIAPDNKGTVSTQEQEQEQEHKKGQRQEREAEGNVRERLKRHRREVAGRVRIPEIWGQEEFLKDWIDCSVFDACLVPSRVASARAALVEEGRRANSTGLRIENR